MSNTHGNDVFKYIKHTLHQFNPQWNNKKIDFSKCDCDNDIIKALERNSDTVIIDQNTIKGNFSSGHEGFDANKNLFSEFHKKYLGIIPFSLWWNSDIGRHFVSSRRINAGEVLIIEPPALIAPLVFSPFKNSKMYCVDCIKNVEKPLYCKQCGFFLCKSEECGQHQTICSILQVLNQTKELEKVARLNSDQFLSKTTNMEQEEKTAALKIIDNAISILTNNYNVKILNYYPMLATLKTLLTMKDNVILQNAIQCLQSNVDEKSRQYAVNNKKIVNVIIDSLKLPYKQDYVHKIASIWDTNGFEVLIHDGKVKTQGIYPASSFLTHSCVPNCEHSFSSEGVMILRAVENIEKDTILTICYTDQLWPTYLRTDHLLKTKGFICECNRCLDPTELNTYIGSVLCSDCRGFILNNSESKIKCENCSKDYEKKYILDIEAKCSGELKNINGLSVEKVNETELKWSNVLHPNHYLLLKLKIEMLKRINKNRMEDICDIEALKSISQNVQNILKSLLPTFSKQKEAFVVK